MAWLIGYVFGYIVAATLIAGWFVADMTGTFKPVVNSRRREWGVAIAFALAASIMWPAMLPLFFFSVGFAEHGWGYKK